MSDIDKTLCDEALSIVQGARRERYDKPERNFERIALVWQALTDRPFTAHEVALMFVGLKIVRQAFSAQRDNIVDGIGYLLCADAVLEKAVPMPEVKGSVEQLVDWRASAMSHPAATSFREQWGDPGPLPLYQNRDPLSDTVR